MGCAPGVEGLLARLSSLWLMADQLRTYANTACPYCSVELDPLPKAKKRCSGCGQPIYVRSGPDGLTYLLQVGDLPVLEAAWAEYLEATDYRAKVAALGVDFDALEVDMHRQNPAYKPRDIWWAAVNTQIVDALKRSDWSLAQAAYFAHAQDLAEHHQPWAEVARAGFAMMLRRYLEEADRAEILACDCRICRPDHGRLLTIAAEILAPTLPHADCEKGWCACDYLPSFA